MAELSHSTLVKNWFLGYSDETCYNYERLQGLGNTNAFIPVIRELYPDSQQADELKKYLVFFNTEPSWIGTVTQGITAAMEEKRANGEEISADDIMSLRAALMGPLAGNFAGPILFEVIYKVLMLGLGYNMYMLGYKKGRSVIVDLLQTGILNKILEAVSIVGLMVVGAMTASNVKLDLSFVDFTFTNNLGAVEFNLQTGVFDALLPGLLPLLVVLGVWALLRKRMKPMTIILVIFALGLVLIAIKAMMGTYA